MDETVIVITGAEPLHEDVVNELPANGIVIAADGAFDHALAAGLTPAGFSFPLLPAPSAVGDLKLSEITGASASGFTRLGLIAWVFGGELHASWNAHASHLSPATLARLASAPFKKIVDIISQNQTRIVDAPEIVDALGNNPLTGRAVIEKILSFLGVTTIGDDELTVRGLDHRPDVIPALHEAGPFAVYSAAGVPTTEGIVFSDAGRGIFTAKLPVGKKTTQKLIELQVARDNGNLFEIRFFAP